MFNSYVKLPEGTVYIWRNCVLTATAQQMMRNQDANQCLNQMGDLACHDLSR